MILDVTGDLSTYGRRLKQLVFNDRIIGLLGKLPAREALPSGRLVHVLPAWRAPVEYVAKELRPGWSG
jgi:hypothetical protein